MTQLFPKSILCIYLVYKESKIQVHIKLLVLPETTTQRHPASRHQLLQVNFTFITS